jgi:hypothetical protein
VIRKIEEGHRRFGLRIPVNEQIETKNLTGTEAAGVKRYRTHRELQLAQTIKDSTKQDANSFCIAVETKFTFKTQRLLSSIHHLIIGIKI